MHILLACEKVVSGDQSDASLVLHTVCLEVGQSVKDCWRVLDCQVNLSITFDLSTCLQSKAT